MTQSGRIDTENVGFSDVSDLRTYLEQVWSSVNNALGPYMQETWSEKLVLQRILCLQSASSWIGCGMQNMDGKRTILETHVKT